MKISKLTIGDIVYYFDGNYRVYEKNGVKKSSPYEEDYYRPLKVVAETEREYILDYGTINKRSNLLTLGKTKHKYFMNKERLDEIYLSENGYKIADKIRYLRDANKLKKIEEILK